MTNDHDHHEPQLKVRDLMAPSPVTIQALSSLAQVTETLAEYGHQRAPGGRWRRFGDRRDQSDRYRSLASRIDADVRLARLGRARPHDAPSRDGVRVHIAARSGTAHDVVREVTALTEED